MTVVQTAGQLGLAAASLSLAAHRQKPPNVKSSAGRVPLAASDTLRQCFKSAARTTRKSQSATASHKHCHSNIGSTDSGHGPERKFSGTVTRRL
jgi:hypothetical protein